MPGGRVNEWRRAAGLANEMPPTLVHLHQRKEPENESIWGILQA